ncbi:MAG: ABC transporter permease [Lactobacillus sp.]|uniref:ABC transporter permease n=1 Tax=Lactobacillus sp. TaxID=1591 RepID=UPI0026476A62|nr:ABC transporter permease [Lactobacillus sp.]MDN5956270.1 ABC transporter permease [Lactobacillus sp.]MDN5989663.1 ABC transporter permease [Lactobacillus sp.]MDN6009289.1 ABC transporter permease [Lactobacillus sp.]MDN6653902.1 ABC transporter permease [Lactobacillus sp.]
MTSFSALFKQMFVQKRRYAHLVLLVQTFAVIFMFLMDLITSNNFAKGFLVFAQNSHPKFCDIIFALGIITTAIGDLVFLGLLCWQNEKINLSQTWHLIPVSDIKLWWINILTSVVQCAYIFVIQVVLGIIVLIFDCMSYGPSFSTMNKKVGFSWSWPDVMGVIEMPLSLIGLVLIIFCFVSFVDLLTRTITDQLPGKNSTVIKIFVMAILVIIGVTIAFKINDQLTAAYMRHLMKNSNGYSVDTLPMAIIEFFAGSIILGAINSFLIEKFVEPKIR